MDGKANVDSGPVDSVIEPKPSKAARFLFFEAETVCHITWQTVECQMVIFGEIVELGIGCGELNMRDVRLFRVFH